MNLLILIWKVEEEEEYFTVCHCHFFLQNKQTTINPIFFWLIENDQNKENLYKTVTEYSVETFLND